MSGITLKRQKPIKLMGLTSEPNTLTAAKSQNAPAIYKTGDFGNLHPSINVFDSVKYDHKSIKAQEEKNSHNSKSLMGYRAHTKAKTHNAGMKKWDGKKDFMD